MPAFDYQVSGLREQIGRFERMADAQRMLKSPVQASLNVYRDEARASVKKLTGKAAAAMGTHIHTKKWGVYGNAGPRGTGRFREGFLAGIFLQSGTGKWGPLKHDIQAQERHVLRRRFAHGMILDAMKAQPSGGLKSRYKAATNANPGMMRGGVMTFPAYGTRVGEGTAFGAMFGAGARTTNRRGQYRQRRYGALGMVFASHTHGMQRQPWAKAAHAQAQGPALEAFRKEFSKNLREASSGR